MAATGAWNSADLAGETSKSTGRADAKGAIVQLQSFASGSAIAGAAAVVAVSQSTAASVGVIAGSASIRGLSAQALVAPTFAVVSPTEETTPGGAGGFPADPTAASQVPIVIDVGLSTMIFATVTRGSRVEEIAYHDGTWRGGYALASSQSVPSAGVIRLSILPDDGWDSDVVVSIDAYGTGEAGHFGGTWYLPGPPPPPTPPSPEVPDGSIDYVAQAFAELPWILASVEGP